MLSQRQCEPIDTDETDTISSGELAHGDRGDIKLQPDKQSPDSWHHRLQSGNLAPSTPTHRRVRPGPELVHSLDELTEISSIAAVVALQRCILHGYAHDRLYRFTRAITSQYLEAPITTSTSGASKTFFDVSSAQEFFEWLKGPFVSTAYMDASAESSSSLTNNRIIGGMRIGQLRVQSFNCSSRVTPFFSWSEVSTDDGAYYCYGSCDGDFTLSIETNDPIQVSNGVSYVFEGLNDTDTDTERSAFFSTMSVSSAQYSLPAPAYSVVLPRSNEAQASSIVTTLEKNGYIDGHTRVVMLDLGLYNAMLRQVATLRFLVELPPSGGAIVSLSAGVAPLTESFLLDADHWVISACQIIVMLFYAFFFLDEVLALARARSREWQYQAVWQRSNLGKNKTRHKTRPSPLHRRHGTGARLLGLLCYACAWLLRLIALVKRPSELPLDSDKFVPLRPYVETFRAAQLALSASVCLAWIELLLMLRVSPHVDLMVRAVECASPQLLVLIIMISLVVMGYASACLLVLGAQSQLFQSLPEALRSLLSILLQTGTGAATGTTGASSLLGFSSTSFGEVGHDAAGTSTLRTLLLACFLLLNVFVAANLFLVVVYEGYLKAKREIEFDRQRRHPPSRRAGDDEDSIEAAPLHLNLGLEIAVYGRALGAKLINLVPRKLMPTARRREAAEMQSAVLPADMPDSKLSPDHDESGDEYYGDDASSSERQWGKNSHRRDTARSSPKAKRHSRGSSRDRPSDSTRLLEGMVLQLALQNEALLRAVNELKQDVQALQRQGDTGTSERDVLRRGPVALATPARVHKQRKAPVTGVSTLVTVPASPTTNSYEEGIN
ncbi:TRP-like ion channel Pkd2 [Phytophthora pseudosyringae]|uniref:TRP-like ion channel Pkd2 n=1 Tax=Phytophthora pseudosyringae TaxID=221518 RepID=A0A8T1VR94_9STRA|nr:TRP-like ion channel Pkd2 [Phytophthora pseudosyringae]